MTESAVDAESDTDFLGLCVCGLPGASCVNPDVCNPYDRECMRGCESDLDCTIYRHEDFRECFEVDGDNVCLPTANEDAGIGADI